MQNLKLAIFLIIPTFAAVIIAKAASTPSAQQFLVLAFIILITFSIPHFTLSFFRDNFSWRSSNFKKIEIGIVIALCLLLITYMFIRNNPYKNLIFVFFTMYQSWHYAMQSYGTSEYFQKKVNQTTGISKFFYLFIGFYFFKNTITTYLNLLGDTFLLKRLSFLTHSPFLNDLVCLLLTLGIVLIWYKKQKRDLSKISQLTTLVWILWAVFAKFPFFYFFLPALHSLQYFFFLKINKRKKLNVIFFTAFCSTLIGVIILLSYHQNNLYRIELMTTLILILNSLHILTDSQGWKHV